MVGMVVFASLYLGSLMSFLKSEKCSDTVQAMYYRNWIVPISLVWFGRFGLVWCSLLASLYLGSLMSFSKSEKCSGTVQAMYCRNWIVQFPWFGLGGLVWYGGFG